MLAEVWRRNRVNGGEVGCRVLRRIERMVVDAIKMRAKERRGFVGWSLRICWWWRMGRESTALFSF